MSFTKERPINVLNESTTDVIDTLPEDFCQDPDNAYTLPKTFYTSKSVFEK